ncbi:MAG: hypothetical protein RR246_01115 [Clostridia bacterium]
MLFSYLLERKGIKSPTEHEKFVNDEKMLFKSDIKREQNNVSVRDVLTINDAQTKRDAILNIFRTDSEKFITELKIALNDPDTEVSHYASSALTEIKRKYENAHISLSAKMEETPDDFDIKISFVTLMNSYISYDIVDRNNKNKYMRSFCNVAEELLNEGCFESKGVKGEIYKSLLMYRQKLGEVEKAVQDGKEYLAKNESESSYFALLELYYTIGDKENFFITANLLRESKVVISQSNINVLRFFMGGEGTKNE